MIGYLARRTSRKHDWGIVAPVQLRGRRNASVAAQEIVASPTVRTVEPAESDIITAWPVRAGLIPWSPSAASRL
jgi:hypothetical protein